MNVQSLKSSQASLIHPRLELRGISSEKLSLEILMKEASHFSMWRISHIGKFIYNLKLYLYN